MQLLDDDLRDLAQTKPNSDEFFKSLLQKVPLSKINDILEELIPAENRNQVYIDFFDYQILHANQVMEWQTDLIYNEMILARSNEIYQENQNSIPKNFQEYCDDLESSVPSLFKLQADSPHYQKLKKFMEKNQAAGGENENDKEEMNLWYQTEMKPKLEETIKNSALEEATNELQNVISKTKAKDSIVKEFILDIKTLIETTSWKSTTSMTWNCAGKNEIIVNGLPRKVPVHVAQMYESCEKALVSNEDFLKHLNDILKIGRSAASTHVTSFFRQTRTFTEELSKGSEKEEKIPQKKFK